MQLQPIELNEAFADSMPKCIREFLLGSGGRGKRWINELVKYKDIALDRANFVKYPIPTSNRDPIFKDETKLKFYVFDNSRVYITTINDDWNYVYWNGNYTYNKYLPAKALIENSKEIYYLDLTDPNIAVNALGKGTPGRIAKTWTGNDAEDTTELLSGRWNKEPALSVFPNDGIDFEVVKKVDIVAVCSHHFLPFSTLNEDSYAIIRYIPRERVLGISKLQRFTNWAARRGWLQEDLTRYLGETIKRIAKTPDVKVELVNLVHSCEKFRGAEAHKGSLTTVYTSGIYKTNNEISSKKQLNE